MREETKEAKNKATERDIENYLVHQVKSLGGMCIKLSPDWYTGIPDRLCLLPKGRAFFVEVKAPGKRERKAQRVFGNKLRELGFTALVVDSKCLVNKTLNIYA